MFLLYLNMLFIIFLSLFIVFTRNSILSILCLILVYILTAFLFIILGAEFLAILLIIVYVGAIAILFLFIIMLLNLRVLEFHNIVVNYFLFMWFIFIFFIFFFYFLNNGDLKISYFINFEEMAISLKNNIILIGYNLYVFNGHLLIIIGDVLLLTLLGSLILISKFLGSKSEKKIYTDFYIYSKKL